MMVKRGRGQGHVTYFSKSGTPPNISGMAEGRNLKFCRQIDVRAYQTTNTTSSSAIAEKPRCSVGQFWVAITPYSADRPISIISNQIEIID